MTRPTPDFFAKIQLYPTDAGGRSGPTPPDALRCIAELDGKNFGVFLWLQEAGSLQPGASARVPASFIAPELASSHVALGKRFFIREGRRVGEGTIDEIVSTPSAHET